jgi:putative glycosyltransferase (TIGR04372 family)
VIYADFPAYKATILELCPQVLQAHPIAHRPIPVQAFSRKGLKNILKRAPMDPETEAAFRGRLRDTHMLVTPNMRHSAVTMLHPSAKFRIPPAREEALEAQLKALGVDPGRFIVTMHCREGAYHGDTSNTRNVDPMVYYEAARHIIENQGGQVLRLGEASASALPETRGLVDLSRAPASLMLQAYAVSRSRYALCSHSGLMHLAMAFQTPLAAADAVNHTALANYPDAVCLTKTYVSPDGEEFRQEKARLAGLLELPGDVPPEGFTIRDSTAEDLIALSDRLFEMTPGVSIWRTPEIEPVYSPDAALFARLTGGKDKPYSDFKFL